MAITPLKDSEFAAKGVKALADRPNQPSGYGQSGLSAAQLKAWFDNLAVILKDKQNEIIAKINNGAILGDITYDGQPLENVIEKMLSDIISNTSAASNAQSTADTAVYKANAAQLTANIAVEKADAAQSTADTAKSIAETAKETSNQNSQNIEKIISNTTKISTSLGGFAAGKDVNIESDGVGIGSEIRAQTFENVSIGRNIISYSEKSVSIGNNLATNGNENNVNIGSDSRVDGENNIAIGVSAKAEKYGAVGIGNGAWAMQDEAIAIGSSANANATGAVQIGRGTNSDPNTMKFWDKRIVDADGNLYEGNIKLKDIYLRRTFLENLYFTRTGALTATLENAKPTANANNYLTTTTTNTSLDFGSATKLTVTRTLATKLQLDKNDSIRIAMSFATNRNASIEFGARILIGGVAVSSNQAFGLNTVNGDTGFTNVNDVSINITCDLIIGSQEFEAGQILTIEIFTRQASAQSLITRYFCGVDVGGADRNCFAGVNATATSIDTSQILDGAITEPKIADGAVSEDKLSAGVKDKFAQANIVNPYSTEPLENIKIEDKIYDIPSVRMKVSDTEYPESVPIKTLIIDDDKYSFIAKANIKTIEFTGQYSASAQKGIFDSSDIFTTALPKAISFSAIATVQGIYTLLTIPQQIDASTPFAGITLKGFLWGSDGSLKTAYVEIYNDGYAVKGTSPAQDLTEGITDFKVIIQYLE